MKRVVVIGCPGSGKSTFAKHLHDITKIPLFHLDLMYWNPDKTTVSKTVFWQKLRYVMEQERWILDGNYGATMELRLKASDTVFFLDVPPKTCLEGIRARKGRARSDMPWVETEDDEEFLSFIKNFSFQSRPSILELLEHYADRSIYRFQSREEAELYLRLLEKSFHV